MEQWYRWTCGTMGKARHGHRTAAQGDVASRTPARSPLSAARWWFEFDSRVKTGPDYAPACDGHWCILPWAQLRFLKHPLIAAAWCRGKSSPCRLMPIPFGSGQAHAHLAIPSLPRTQRHTQQPPGADSSGSGGLFPAPPPAPASSCKIHPAPADVFSAKKIQSF